MRQIIGLLSVLTFFAPMSWADDTTAQKEFTTVHDSYLAKYKPLVIASNQAWWDASISGKDEDFKKRADAEKTLVDLHSDKETFAQLKALREGGKITDPIQKRELDVMYRTFLPYQADAEISKKIVDLAAQVDQIFQTHRSKVGDKELTENDVRKILGDSKNGDEAKSAWLGYMEVGKKVETTLKELVKLRNQVATKLGYKNYFDMQMTIQELDEKQLFKTFDELDALTAKPFAELKKEIDAKMAARFGIKPEELRPWHFGDLFFQEAPELAEASLDDLVQSKDPVQLATAYYKSIGMPVEDIVSRSDLYEKPGKSPHAFCTNINRADDVRVLCNVKPNMRWLDTTLHELGHGVYDKQISPDVPFVLHEPTHILATEAIAMLFGSLAKNEEFLTKVAEVPADQDQAIEAARKSLRAEKLIFSRWTQVMLRFEQTMYNNPEQDLSKVWWDLKKKYQMIPAPDDVTLPGYGAKIHVVSAPVYYHNYMLGELMAAQLHHYIAKNIIKTDNHRATAFFGSQEAGNYLRKEIFEPGNRMYWNDLIKQATGEPLTAKSFAQIYIN